MNGPALRHDPYFLAGIPDGPAGIRATLSIMAKLVRQYRATPQIRQLAESIVQHTEENNPAQEVDALRCWIRLNIRYTQDVRDVETLQTPDALLRSGQGDCDDQATLMAALAESVGYKTRFAAVGFAPDNFAHVFAEVLLGTRWITAETTENVPLNWYPPGVVTRMNYHV